LKLLDQQLDIFIGQREISSLRQKKFHARWNPHEQLAKVPKR